MEVSEGDQFPNFLLDNENGETISLETLRGKNTVVYFYPKDNTPGCTTEACNFRDNIDKFVAMGVPVYGVSVDSAESHKKFKNKYNLPFMLLSDSKKELVGKLGIKSLTGVASRVTFVLDRDGKILKIYPKVSPDSHAEELLYYLNSLK